MEKVFFDGVHLIELGLLSPSPTNPRKHFDEAALVELTESVRLHGVLQNLVVRPLEDGYEVVSGERRYRAAMAAGLTEVLCSVRRLSNVEVLEIQVIENLQREDVSPVEEADGYAALLAARPEWTRETLAARIGKSESYVRDRLALRRAPQEMMAAVAEGTVPLKTAVAVGRIPDGGARREAARRILRPETQVEPLGHAAAVELIRECYMVRVADGYFDPEDGGLTQAGPCSVCEYFSDNVPVEEEREAGPRGRRGLARGLCMRPSCWREKEEAAWERMRDDLPAGVSGVLPVEAQMKLFEKGRRSVLPGSKWVDIKDKPGFEEVGHVDVDRLESWEVMLSRCGAAAELWLARNPFSGRIHKMVSKLEAMELIRGAAAALGVESPFDGRVSADGGGKKKAATGAVDAPVRRVVEGDGLDVVGAAVEALRGQVVPGVELCALVFGLAVRAAGTEGRRVLAGLLGLDVVEDDAAMIDGIEVAVMHGKLGGETGSAVEHDRREWLWWTMLALVSRGLALDGLEARDWGRVCLWVEEESSRAGADVKAWGKAAEGLVRSMEADGLTEGDVDVLTAALTGYDGVVRGVLDRAGRDVGAGGLGYGQADRLQGLVLSLAAELLRRGGGAAEVVRGWLRSERGVKVK